MIPPAFQYIYTNPCDSHALQLSMFPNQVCCNFCSPHHGLRVSPSNNQYHHPDSQQQSPVHFPREFRINICINVTCHGMLDRQSVYDCSQPFSGRSTQLALTTQAEIPNSNHSFMSVDREETTILRAHNDVNHPKPAQNSPVFFSSGSELPADPPEAVTFFTEKGKKRTALAETFFKKIGEVLSKVLKEVPLAAQDLELGTQQVEVVLTFLVRKFSIQSLEV